MRSRRLWPRHRAHRHSPADHQDVVSAEIDRIGRGLRLGCQQHQATVLLASPRVKRGPADMFLHGGVVDIVEPRPRQRLGENGKPVGGSGGWSCQAGPQPDQRAGIVGDVGLVEREIDRHGGFCIHLEAVLARPVEGGRGRAGYSVAVVRCHPWAHWTSACDSAKRTPTDGPLEGGRPLIPRMRETVCHAAASEVIVRGYGPWPRKLIIHNTAGFHLRRHRRRRGCWRRCHGLAVDQPDEPDASTLALPASNSTFPRSPRASRSTIMWRGLPVFVRHRTPAEIEEAKAVPLSDLKDPETDEQRTKEGHEQWLIMIAIATHLGCVPVGDSGEFDGWFCPAWLALR